MLDESVDILTQAWSGRLVQSDRDVRNAAAGATWWLVEFPAESVTVDVVRAVVNDGPAVPR